MGDDKVIDSGSNDWQPLYDMWIAEGMPGWLAGANGTTYKVLRPGGDEKIKFLVYTGGESMYETTSAKGLVKHGR